MVLANLLLFANFATIKYLLYCGSRRKGCAVRVCDPGPVPHSNTSDLVTNLVTELMLVTRFEVASRFEVNTNFFINLVPSVPQ